MSIPVASLARVSTAGQAGDDRGGLPRQRAAIEEAVNRHGLTVVRAFELPGVGGDKVSSTPAWSEIRGMLSAGSIKGVVVDAVDRLCRASDLDLTVLADLQRAGASIWTPGEVRDLSSATDGLLAGLLALLGGVEKAAITRRAREGKRALRGRGRWTGGAEHLPLGVAFDRATGAWSYTDEAQPILELARRYAAGTGSIRSIVASLGLGSWQARHALRHPLYRGRMSDLAGGWITVLDPPLFDGQLAALVDARIAKSERRYAGESRREGDDPYLLRDCLVCARCGQRMDTVVNQKKDAKRGKTYTWRYYRCAGSNRGGDPERTASPCDGLVMPIDDVHEAVTRAITTPIVQSDGAFFRQAWAALSAEPDDHRAEIERLRARVAELEGQRSRLLRAYMREVIGEAEFEGERIEVDRLLSAVTVELRGLEAEAVDRDTARAAVDAIYAAVNAAMFTEERGDATIPRLIRAAGGRVAIDRVFDPVEAGTEGELWKLADVPGVRAWHLPDGRVMSPAKRRGWFTVLAGLTVDVGRALTIGASELREPAAEFRTKNAASSTK